MKQIKCIGILTSGGDASGMNAAIRAVTRSAIFNGYTVKGIYRGYEGLIRNEIKEFTTQDVSSIPAWRYDIENGTFEGLHDSGRP